MTDDRAAIAHLLRRTSFGPFPGKVDALNPGGVTAALEGVLAATPPPLPAPPPLDGWRDPAVWWMQRMADPNVGLHEKMTWFWHSHLCTSQDKVNNWPMMWTQHVLLRQHALGNFRTMLQAITIDPAMLVYLDGDPSVVEAPNENYSREVMELFALGIGAYTEADVRAGAKALAGWEVNYDTGVASFLPQYALTSPVTFLGQSVLRAADVINAVCDSPACAPFIAGKLYKFFMGADPSASRRTELATVFRDGNLEIRPLVEAILRDPMFFDPGLRMNRARMPVEWVPAAFAAVNGTDPDQATNVADDMGQVPFYPPSVAGWPGGTRFLAASDARSRADVGDNAPALAEIATAGDPVTATLNRCSIYEVTTATRSALTTAAGSTANPNARARLLLGLAISSPDFALA